jgi:hypothetical protein
VWTNLTVHLENLVLCDLLAWRDALVSSSRPDICCRRTASGDEIDVVIDLGSRFPPTEVKATTRPRVFDARYLQAFCVNSTVEPRGRACCYTPAIHS